MVGEIVPKKKTKGVDFCAVDDRFFIVRSDLHCYMKAANFNRGLELNVYSLHPSCTGGDHYLASKDGLFFIIKGTSYRRVSNMNRDLDAVVYTLHPKFQGGDFYLSAWDNFYAIFLKQGIFRQTKNMNTYEGGVEHPLHPELKNGLYFFGSKNYCFYVKPQDEWGIQYARTTNIHKDFDTHSETFSFHPDVVNFMPGGLGITKGLCYGEWVCIKTITNDSQTPVTWQNKVTKKIGYEKQKMSSVEHNWNVSSTVSAETGGVTALIAQVQLSMTAEYGGCSVNTDQETWSEAHETEETVSVTLQANQKVYIWTYQLGMGKDPMLYCRDMRILDSPEPPTDCPLPPTSK